MTGIRSSGLFLHEFFSRGGVKTNVLKLCQGREKKGREEETIEGESFFSASI